MKKILSAILSLFLILAVPEPFFGAEAEITGEITVSLYHTMLYKDFLEYDARSFEQKHPEVKVNVKAFSAMPVIKTVVLEDGSMIAELDFETDQNGTSDYLTRINVEMMSGGGADIYAVDVLPYYKYVDAGHFEDMRPFMDNDPDFDYDDYHRNIFDAAMYKGGQYILPIDYNFECLSYDSTLMDQEAQEKFSFGKYTYEQLAELGYDSFAGKYDTDAGETIKMFNLYSSDGGVGGNFYDRLLKADYASIIDVTNKKANFTDGRFEGILETAKEYEDKGYLTTPINYETIIQARSDSSDALSSEQRYLYKSTYQFMFIYSMMDDDIMGLSGGNGSNMISRDDTLIGLPANDKGESMFTASQIYAMNSNSKNKQAVWEFIKFLLSDEMQGLMSISYTPVNKNAAAQKAKMQIATMMSTGKTGIQYYKSSDTDADIDAEDIDINADIEDGGNDINTDVNAEEYDINASLDVLTSYSYFDNEVELTEKQQAVYDSYMDYMDRYASMLNAYVIHDDTIDEMIAKEVQDFFGGKKTAKEVAAILQNKVNLYLQE